MSRWIDRTGSIGSDFPAAAEDCAVIYDPVDHRIVVIGGKNDDDEILDEVWSLDLASNVWSRVETRGDAPSPTEDHAGVYDPVGRRVIVHGGEDGIFSRSYTWSLDLKRNLWRRLEDDGAPSREDHSAIYVDRNPRMVIFGGRDRQASYDHVNIQEVWALDLDPDSPGFERWRQLTIDGDDPPGRSDHVAVYDAPRNRMVIYGGWDKKKKQYLGDTWVLQFGSHRDAPARWRQIKAKESAPPRRRHVAGAYDAQRRWLIVCGGYGDGGYVNDVWALDLDHEIWLNVSPGPQPRIDHKAIWDPRSQRVLLYGGDARLQTKIHDLWELEMATDLPLAEMLHEVEER